MAGDHLPLGEENLHIEPGNHFEVAEYLITRPDEGEVRYLSTRDHPCTTVKIIHNYRYSITMHPNRKKKRVVR